MSPRKATKRWILPAIATSAVVAAAVTATLAAPDGSDSDVADLGPAVRGVVVDETGMPVRDATVRVSGSIVNSNDEGEFVVPLSEPAVASTQSAGQLPRAQAVAPGEPARIELTAQSEDTMSLRFGGDVSFGRRFYDGRPNEPALLGENATVADHADLLSGAAPLLQDADLTAVNLESPLIDDPTGERDTPRPARFHPTKKTVLASATESAEALHVSGVDVVSLANDRAYDALGPGLQSTTEALDKAGVQHFGAGPNEDEAWEPAIVTRPEGTVAYVGCTTVDGENHPIPYVADDDRGGAAECSAKRLRKAIDDASERADTVAVMIHGGTGMSREQSPAVRSLLDTATKAGATVAVAGHPHVIGGMQTAGPTAVVESTGNLLFDQSTPATTLSQLPRIDVRGGAPVHTSTDPLVLDNYRPRPVVGALADSVSRITAGVVDGATRMQQPGTVMSAHSAKTPGATPARLPADTPTRLAPGWWIDHVPPRQRVRSGNDLLWGRGSFEDMDTHPAIETRSSAPSWELGRAARTVPSASCASQDDEETTGSAIPDTETTDHGVELVRSPLSTKDVYAAPDDRVGVTAGQQVSLIADVRSASPGSELELRWYNSMTGKSTGSTEVAIPEGKSSSDECRQVRVDAVVPPGAVAARPFLRLSPPDDTLTGPRLAVDDVRLIAWAPEGEAGRRFDTVEAAEPITLSARTDRADGGNDPLQESEGSAE